MSDRYATRIRAAITEGRELTAAEAEHLAGCNTCRDTANGAHAFANELDAALARRRTEPLPADPLVVAPPLRRRSWTTAVGAMAVVLLAIGSAAIGSQLVATPGPPSSTHPSPSAEPSLVPGAFAEATHDDVQILRELGSEIAISSIYTGEQAYVVAVSLTADGSAWLRVQTGASTFGWIELDPKEPQLRVLEPACPEGPSDRVFEVAELMALPPWQRLQCFAGHPLRVEPVTSRTLTNDIPYGGTPEWLADEPSLNLHGRGGFMSNDGPLLAHIDPADGVRMEEGAWYSVELQVDHPASSDCRRDLILAELGIDPSVALDLAPVVPEDATLWCQQQFVVTAARPIAAPPPGAQPQARPAGGSWRAVPEAPILPRSENGAAWTGSEFVVWGGRATTNDAFDFHVADDGAAYDPTSNSWRSIAPAPLAGRTAPIMAWTGSEVLVVGGADDDFQPMTDGAAYDPLADSWRTIRPMPDGIGFGHAWAWSGEELVVVSDDGTSAAAYSPSSDTWTDLGTPPLPDDLYAIGAASTGDEVIVIGYPNGVTVAAAGASWDPATGRWRRLPESPILALNAQPSPIWTGEEIVVFSRSFADHQPDGVPPDTTYGSFYDPRADRWRVAAVQDAYLPIGPLVRTGDLLVGVDAVYDTVDDAWREPPRRPDGAWGPPVSTGDEIIFWGGSPGGDILYRFNNGIAYSPHGD